MCRSVTRMIQIIKIYIYIYLFIYLRVWLTGILEHLLIDYLSKVLIPLSWKI